MKKYKIGIFGSAFKEKAAVIACTIELGKELGKRKSEIIIINGATTGIPAIVAREAFKKGIKIWGFSPATDLTCHQEMTPGDNGKIYQRLIFVPKNFPYSDDLQACRKYRNVISIANCDAGIIISGRWGTMNEFTNLYDMGKVIGVLTGTGGIADELPRLMKKIVKKSKARVIFEKSPEKLINKILKGLNQHK